jgi:hypothetical protein
MRPRLALIGSLLVETGWEARPGEPAVIRESGFEAVGMSVPDSAGEEVLGRGEAVGEMTCTCV